MSRAKNEDEVAVDLVDLRAVPCRTALRGRTLSPLSPPAGQDRIAKGRVADHRGGEGRGGVVNMQHSAWNEMNTDEDRFGNMTRRGGGIVQEGLNSHESSRPTPHPNNLTSGTAGDYSSLIGCPLVTRCSGLCVWGGRVQRTAGDPIPTARPYYHEQK